MADTFSDRDQWVLETFESDPTAYAPSAGLGSADGRAAKPDGEAGDAPEGDDPAGVLPTSEDGLSTGDGEGGFGEPQGPAADGGPDTDWNDEDEDGDDEDGDGLGDGWADNSDDGDDLQQKPPKAQPKPPKTEPPPPAKVQVALPVVRAPDIVIPVEATGVLDFLTQAKKTVGKNRLGYTECVLPPGSFQYDADKRVEDVFGSATVTITRAEARGTWDENNTTAIREVERLNREHEEHHRSDDDVAVDRWFSADFMNGLIGKTQQQAAVLWNATQLACRKEMQTRSDELHKTEGNVAVVRNADGTFNVTDGKQ